MTLRTLKESQPKVLMAVLAESDGAIRRETYMGREHVVIPVIALVEGVHRASNSPSEELALADEFGKHPQSWDGRPVVLNHPKRKGVNVSANSPTVLEEEQFGHIFNTQVLDGKLHLEAWIDPERAEALGDDHKELLETLESGEVVEVSTGFYLSVDPRSGRFNGESYKGVWRDIVPDHLAILGKGIRGACSVADGCGTNRVNAEGDCECSGTCQKCNANCEVLSMPKLNAEDEEETSEDPKAKAKDKKDKKDKKPKEDKERKMSEDTTKPWFLRFAEAFGDLIGFRSNSLSDQDRRTALEIALQGSKDCGYLYVVAVYPDDSNVVYYHSTYEEQGFYRRSFEITEDGSVILGDNAEQVRPVTDFVPVNNTRENNAMTTSNADKVTALIANTRTRFAEKDRKFLEGLEDEQLALLEPAEEAEETVETAPNTPAPAAVEDPPTDPTRANAASTPNATKTMVTAADYVASAPPEVQAVLNEGLQRLNAERANLTEIITKNPRNRFAEATLVSFDLDTLRSIADIANLSSYSGQNGGRTLTVVPDEANARFADEAPKAFAPKDTKAAGNTA